MADEHEEQQRRKKSERELSEHDKAMARASAHASRDTLHDASAWQERGAYTVHESRDRAAHTPSVLDRDMPRTRAEEERMIDALYKDLFPPEEPRQKDASQATPKENEKQVTPEQQASVDKALGRAELNDKIGGASEVGGKPQANDPTPMDKARDMGQDLHKSGVTMEKE